MNNSVKTLLKYRTPLIIYHASWICSESEFYYIQRVKKMPINKNNNISILKLQIQVLVLHT